MWSSSFIFLSPAESPKVLGSILQQIITLSPSPGEVRGGRDDGEDHQQTEHGQNKLIQSSDHRQFTTNNQYLEYGLVQHYQFTNF